jgi:hypothetical protein
MLPLVSLALSALLLFKVGSKWGLVIALVAVAADIYRVLALIRDLLHKWARPEHNQVA